MASEAAARKFFTAPFFAVVGQPFLTLCISHAANIPNVHAWYLNHSLPVTPINPGSPTVSVNGKDHATVPNVGALTNPKETGVSIITHPAVTINVLREAKKVGVPSVWLQPGTFDSQVLEFALGDGNFEAVVYGDGGRGSEGWCVLVDGEAALKAVGKL
ncbi:hypothetical protein S40285_01491 [Stachybotrys chlorohalonatus IBT 40285]|uniref:CoA-binding domain-containing protein n=1 Tax=Stachybotrys chlorohalonatus (strain IBT 40285) TaxID=1283841 RepID=A0A084QMK0_STAC4|nr:hypothetical protein S40285_01491 [Stachybotrys chlorohalonata IBT 40285]